jgi:hypothetical protein
MPEDVADVPLTTADPLVDRIDRLERTVTALQAASIHDRAAKSNGAADAVIAALVPAAATVAATAAGKAVGNVVGFTNPLRELRLMLGMYFDPRYRLSRIAQFGVPGILMLIALNYVLFGWWVQIPLFSLVIERVNLIVLAVVLYKILAREAARYADVLRYLAQYGR